MVRLTLGLVVCISVGAVHASLEPVERSPSDIQDTLNEERALFDMATFAKRQTAGGLDAAAMDLQDLLQTAIAGQATNICQSECAPWISSVRSATNVINYCATYVIADEPESSTTARVSRSVVATTPSSTVVRASVTTSRTPSRSSMVYVPVSSRTPVVESSSDAVDEPEATPSSTTPLASPVEATNNVAVAATQVAGTSSNSSASSGSNAGAIAGGVVGGLAALALLIGLIVYLKKRKNNRKSPLIGSDEQRRPSLWSHMSQTSADPPVLPAIPRANLWNESVDPTNEALSPFNEVTAAVASSNASSRASRRSSNHSFVSANTPSLAASASISGNTSQV
ncbi:hypothetical protein OIO90_002977 [Microbotryomycetes sp. JL221]|nr:hypothetical protein OIO90_002977 [Microbotryomycetes sp. JL221]